MGKLQDFLTNARATAQLEFSRSARRDFRIYALTAIGLVFTYAGATVDPASNCSADGECAPWLVPVALCIGILATAAGFANLWRNPRRGSRIDLQQRRLHWWNEVLTLQPQSLALDGVATVRVETQWEDHRIYLLDGHGKPLPFPRDEVIPWPYEDWARSLASHFPHIKVDVIR